MTDDPNARTYESRRLASKLRFTTYSDAKLAGLFLGNDFPVVLFTKVLDVIRDPAFKADEVSFEDVWDMFAYISARRRKDAVRREFPSITSPERTEVNCTSVLSGVVPPVVLDLVVDKLLEVRTPLGVAAMDPWWTNAFASNLEPFHNMSFVHRSWTHIAQRGLRHRVVVPYQHVGKFLLSPFCGPWINEMIIYWSVENGNLGITKGDIWVLEALLERTPNLHSLAFNTSLIWPREYLQPSFDVDICIEIIADLLPNLERLWLKHLPLPELNDSSLETCSDIRSLCLQLPKLQALRFLSIRSWSSEMGSSVKQSSLNWDEHPPPHLTTMELDLTGGLIEDDLKWLVKPRHDFRLQSVSFTARSRSLQKQDHSVLRQSLQECIPEVRRMQICTAPSFLTMRRRTYGTGQSHPFYTNLLLDSANLTRLDLFVMDDAKFDQDSLYLPSCLEQLSFHFFDDTLQRYLSQYSISDTGFVEDLITRLPALPRLQSIFITGSRRLEEEKIYRWDLDAFIHHMNEDTSPLQDGIPDKLLDLCRERSIQLIIVTGAFPRRWDIPRGEYHLQDVTE